MTNFVYVLGGRSSQFSTFAFSLTDDDPGSSLACSTSALSSTAISGVHFLQPPFCHLPAYFVGESSLGLSWGFFYTLEFLTLGPPFTWMLPTSLAVGVVVYHFKILT